MGDVPGNRAVFTCRTLDYGAMLSSKDVGVPHIRLEPMTRNQVLEYVGLHLPEQADLVHDVLRRDARALSLYRTPYMLRLLVNQVRAVGTVPVGRVDAFAGMVRELLRREILSGNPRTADPDLLTDREQRRLRDGVSDPLWLPNRGHLVPALTRLAYQMQETKRGEDKGSVVVDYDTAVDLLNGLARLAEASLRVGCDTGILDEEEEAISFFHQLLQEFFAARQLAAVPDFSRLMSTDTAASVTPSLSEVLTQLAPGEPLPPLPTTGWEETAVMAAALAENPDAYVRDILAVNPALAGRCLAAPDVRVDASVRIEVTNTLVARSADPATDLRARIHYGRILGDPRLARRDSPQGTSLVPEFADIPAGTHRIGAENTPYALERPVHEVTLPAFGLARRPVTNAEYAHFIVAGGYDDDHWWRTAHARRWRRGEGIHDLIADEWRKKRDNLRRRPTLPVDMLRTGAATVQQAVSMVKLTTMTDGALRSALTDIYGTEPPRAPAYWYDSLLGHPSAPVVGVSVYEAEAYCAWLSAATGEPIHSPLSTSGRPPPPPAGASSRTATHSSRSPPTRSNSTRAGLCPPGSSRRAGHRTVSTTSAGTSSKGRRAPRRLTRTPRELRRHRRTRRATPVSVAGARSDITRTGPGRRIGGEGNALYATTTWGSESRAGEARQTARDWRARTSTPTSG